MISFKARPAAPTAPTSDEQSDRADDKHAAGAAGDLDVDEALGWFASSIELHLGLQVCEDPADTIPADLFDELFKR